MCGGLFCDFLHLIEWSESTLKSENVINHNKSQNISSRRVCQLVARPLDMVTVKSKKRSPLQVIFSMNPDYIEQKINVPFTSCRFCLLSLWGMYIYIYMQVEMFLCQIDFSRHKYSSFYCILFISLYQFKYFREKLSVKCFMTLKLSVKCFLALKLSVKCFRDPPIGTLITSQ